MKMFAFNPISIGISPSFSPPLFAQLATDVLSTAVSNLLPVVFKSIITTVDSTSGSTTASSIYTIDEDALQLDLSSVGGEGESAIILQETVRSGLILAIQGMPTNEQQQHCLSTTAARLASPEHIKASLRLNQRRRLALLTERLLRLVAASGCCYTEVEKHSKVCLIAEIDLSISSRCWLDCELWA